MSERVSDIEYLLNALQIGMVTAADGRRMLDVMRPHMSAEEIAKATRFLGILEIREGGTVDPQYLGMNPDGWFRTVLDYAQISESPDSFHFWTAMTVVSHLIGRRTTIYIGPTRSYLNLNTFLVSPAGALRRSSCIRSTVEIGREAGARVIQDVASPEGLLRALSEEPHAIFVSDEAAVILSKVDYMASMPQILCSLLDYPEQFDKTLAKGTSFSIQGPALTSIMGCAPDWFRNMPRHATGGGLMSRYIVVYESKKTKVIPFPEHIMPEEDAHKLRSKVIRDLRSKIEHVPERITLTDEAKELYDPWYRRNEEECSAADGRMAPWLARRPIHVRKVAGILAIMDGDEVVTPERFELALAHVRLIEPGMLRCYQKAGLEQPSRLVQTVQSIISKHGGRIDRTTLMKKVQHLVKAKELDTILVHMGHTGSLKWPPLQVEGNNGKFTTYYEIEEGLFDD